MARIRTVKPEMWTDAKIVRLSPLARLLFIGSWNFADDYGALTPDAFQLKLQVLPTESADADELVSELLDAGLFEVLVNADGVRFWHITNWNRHQRVNKPSDSQYGDPTAWKHPPTREFTESPAPVAERSGLNGKEGKGMERKGEEGNGIALTERERNPVWDTLVGIYGEPTPPQQSLYGRVTKFLNEQDASPNDIQLRAQALVSKWGPDTNTVTALEKHWNFLASPAGTLTEDRADEYHAEMQRERRRRELAELDAEVKGLER